MSPAKPVRRTYNHIVDYNAAEGDKIDLQALLDTNFSSESNIDDFVKLTQDGNNI